VCRDHVEIASLVSQLPAPWIVSYDTAPEIEALYGQFASISYDVNYSAHVKHYGSERMFFSPIVNPPAVSSPANIPANVVDELRLAG